MDAESTSHCTGTIRVALSVAGLMLAVGDSARAEIIYVEPGESIQAAIESASGGDEIVVAGEF